MDSKIIKKRNLAAAETRKIILQAASNLFIKSGFEGVSISQIAKKAKINQSLIYHYFESKEELWKNVKKVFVDTYTSKESLKFSLERGLEYTLKQIVFSRFEFYEKNPDIFRMMTWQRLEATKSNLVGGTLFSPENWKEVFLQFKKKGEIREEIDLDMMILFITSLIAGALTEDYQGIFKDQTNKTSYLDLIVSTCMRCFSV